MRKEATSTIIREWARTLFIMLVLSFPYSSISSFVTTNFSRCKAQKASLGRVGAFSIALLDEGTLEGSTNSTDVAGVCSRRTGS